MRADLQIQIVGDLRIGVSKSRPIGAAAKMNPRERPQTIASLNCNH